MCGGGSQLNVPWQLALVAEALGLRPRLVTFWLMFWLSWVDAPKIDGSRIVRRLDRMSDTWENSHQAGEIYASLLS